MSDQISSARPDGSRSAGERFGAFLRNNSFVWLAFFTSAALMLFMWFCNQMSPFGGRTILRIDLYHQYGPLFAELFERLKAGRSLLYSWNSGLGGGFLGNFFNYLSSPTGLLVLLFGHEKVPEAIGVMVLLKCAFASGAFAYMLRKIHNRSDASTAAFGVLYSFCGWMIVYYWNVMWLDGMALLPLVVLGIWYIVHRRKFMLYTLTLAVTLVTNYFVGYMVCIFSVLFFLALFFSGSAEDGPQLAAPEKKRLKDNRFLRTGFTFAYASVLGAALAAFALLPVYMTLKSSSATSGSFPDKLSTNFQIFDFLVNHLADVNPAWRGSGPNVLPNVYCGVGTILLVPLYLFLPKIKAREKAAHLLLLLVMFFSFNTNILNYVWHAFHFPNDLPYRFSFLYSFLLLWIAYQVLLHIKDIPLRALVGVGAGAALFVVLAEKVGSQNILTATKNADKNIGSTIYITLAFLVVYILLFAAMRRTPKERASVSLAMVLLCCVITEVCAADVKNFEITQVKATYTEDLKDFQAVKAQIEARDDGFYRMDVTDRRTAMDPAWYDYPGVTVFSSMAYERTANLENRLGLGGNFINSYHYNPNTAVYNAMHSLKYVIENQNYYAPGRAGSSYLPELEGSPVYAKRDEFTRARFTVFENKYTLPIGFWASSNLRGWDTAVGTNPFRVQGEFWELAGGGAGVFEPLALRLRDDYAGEGGFTASASEQYISFSGKAAGEKRNISCVLEVEEPQNVYIMTDVNYVKAVQLHRADGGFADRSHDTKAIWDLGVVTPEAPLSIDLSLDTDAPANGGFNAYVYGLNMDVFVKGYNTLKRGGLELKRHSDTLLEGTVNAPANGLLYTSIPYDEGWQVSIDGKRVPVSKYIGLGNDDEYLKEGKLKKLWVDSLLKIAVRLDPDAIGEVAVVRSENENFDDAEVVSRGILRSYTPSKDAGWLCRRIAIHVAKLFKPIRGGLLGVPLPEGTHTVTLRYTPPGLNPGMMVSAAALILLALTGLLGELLRRRKERYVPSPPVPELAPLFSTENLDPAMFSLDVPWEGPPPEEIPAPFQAEALPIEEAAPVEETEPAEELPPLEETAFPDEMEIAEGLAPMEEPEPPAAEEETFELNLPEPPADEPADAGAASINAILQEMQARAEELRRKMQVDYKPEGEDGGQSFRLT